MSRFTSIDQFRHTIRNVQHKAQFRGLDEDGEPIMDRSAEMPILTATGTVKLHGTNAGVTLDENGELEVWSRTRKIDIDRDNHGFAFFVKTNEDFFLTFLRQCHPAKATLYGEWCGGNIQKGVALCELEKMFVVFACKVEHPDGPKWVDLSGGPPRDKGEHRIYSIYDFPTYKITIDFNTPAAAQNEMISITEAVEAECPVAKQLGVSGIGEGVVWKLDGDEYNDSGHWWKVKGDKHSVSKVKTMVAIDPEKLASAQAFVETYTTDNRLLQGIEHLGLEGIPVDQKATGTFLKWVVSDILKEEQDSLAASGLEPKDVVKIISTTARKWYFSFLDSEAGLS